MVARFKPNKSISSLGVANLHSAFEWLQLKCYRESKTYKTQPRRIAKTMEEEEGKRWHSLAQN